MKIVSNHLLALGMEFTDDVVIRLNLAWVKSADEARIILKTLRDLGKTIYLDFPEGRSKPPRPIVTMKDAVALAKEFKVDYFAVSNVEDPNTLIDLDESLHYDVKLVPKIETINGVKNLSDIISKSGIDYIMLDKEDLYTSVKANQAEYDELVELARKTCKEYDVTCLELQGVIFS